jgi:nitrite reductase/ring-hydroxylating ferredoxin subunit/multimeric flavodoxin WrbA
MTEEKWEDVGDVARFLAAPVSEAMCGRTRIAVTCRDGELGAIGGSCNHVGGPLGQGRLDGDYVVCPWHNWKFHRSTGKGEPGFEDDCVPAYEVRVRDGRLYVRTDNATRRNRKPHAPHPLARPVERVPGSTRVVGISTTVMDAANPRYSTSEALLDAALEYARHGLACETEHIRLRSLDFRNCEGYYSKCARACTWPCSITQMDDKDEMAQVYEAVVHWADVVLVSTPIRWGVASALYFKMAERLNCVQNEITTHDRVLIRDKVAGFIITGGQDNVQGVAGGMLAFFSELGFSFPPFPFIAHTRGWSAEDMERNVTQVRQSAELREASQALVQRAVELSRTLLADVIPPADVPRGGRKAHRLDVEIG